MQLTVLRTSIVVMGLIYIITNPSYPLALKLVFKLIPMGLIIYYAFKLAPREKNLTHYFIFTGLVFSIIADGAIIYSFIAGLIFFLIGHLFYIGSFSRHFQFSWPRTISLIVLLIYSAILGGQLVHALLHHNQNELVIPVIIYILAIMFMCWLAIMTHNIWVTIGSILFVISDSILAWDKFINSIAYENHLIMVTYYAAQFFIAHSLTTIAQQKEQTIYD